MKAYIHYSDGKPPIRLFNVAEIRDKGVGMVEVKMQFADFTPTHDHVSRVVVEPDKDDVEPWPGSGTTAPE